ncbi:MAG: TonB-dependent receptor [Prevotella sp.]|nr:TonB-dependent receptor [Prevotella sp.]
MNKILIYTVVMLAATLEASAQQDSVKQLKDQTLQEVQVVTRRPGMIRSRGAVNAATITSAELTKAACCNLGESFTTNPSVDVSYSDAATGAKQIKLLGLSGTYVQMLSENIPNYRGVAAPYSLGYIPGPWMQSIQVSKGASSVKNGYESITGQINVEYKKPQLTDQVNANIYGNTMAKFEANADGSVHLTDKWSIGMMLHYEDKYKDHDNNDDGFMDEPNVRQYNSQLRWAYFSPNYIYQAGIRAMKEDRNGGQTMHGGHAMASNGMLYKIGIETQRYETFAKNAFIFDQEHNSNIALILNGSFHQMNSEYGVKDFDVIQRNFYAQLLFETDFTPMHNLATGLSLNHDYYNEWFVNPYLDILTSASSYVAPSAKPNRGITSKETTYGAYAQYTFNLNDKLILMAGVRGDHTVDGKSFFTPRTHIKWAPNDIISLRASLGKGHRYVHPLAENSYLLGTSRSIAYNYDARYVNDTNPYGLSYQSLFEPGETQLEEAWNYGVSTAMNIPLFGKTMQLNAEYYYTDFKQQTIIDYDTDPDYLFIVSTRDKSYSHTFQIDATYPLVQGMTVTAAYRRNIVKSTYGGELLDKPLQSKYKGLFTVSYKPGVGLWQFDATLQLNGGGRMPKPYRMADGNMSWDENFKGFEQVSAQVTRWFRHFSIYLGGENLTGFKQKNPIINASNPWGRGFDPTLIYGPVQGAMFYLGIRFNLEKKDSI